MFSWLEHFNSSHFCFNPMHFFKSCLLQRKNRSSALLCNDITQRDLQSLYQHTFSVSLASISLYLSLYLFLSSFSNSFISLYVFCLYLCLSLLCHSDSFLFPSLLLSLSFSGFFLFLCHFFSFLTLPLFLSFSLYPTLFWYSFSASLSLLCFFLFSFSSFLLVYQTRSSIFNFVLQQHFHF